MNRVHQSAHCMPPARSIHYRAAIPRALRWSAQVGGKSIKRDIPKPRARVPSIAAWTMSGARNASVIPIRADRSLKFSRAAIVSMPAVLPETISPSHRRAFAMATRSFERASARIGRASMAAWLGGWIISRLRRKLCGDQGTAISSDASGRSGSLLRA